MTHTRSTAISTDETTLTALVPIWDSGEETLVFPASGQFLCGSHRNSAAKISLPGVADRHCRMLCRDGDVKVEPFGQHEVRVNDTPVFGSHPLNTGDHLAIGPATFRVERRRAGFMSRVNVINHSPTSTAPAAETTADGVTRQMVELERRLAEAQSTPAAPAPTVVSQLAVPVPAFSMPVLAGATQENRRKLLDAREAQLTEWQSDLELRCVELDNRSTTLARQQALLSERQLEIEKRAKELENWQQETSRTMRVQNEQANADAHREIQQQRAELNLRDEQLNRERADLDAQSRRLEASKQTVAARMEELSEARRTLATERSEYLREQKSVAAEIENRESALHNQQQELAVRAEHVSDLEAERDNVTRLSQQLEIQQADLAARETELSELEVIREDVIQREAALQQLQLELDTAAVELQHLEAIRQDVKTGTAELESLRAQLEPQLATVAELETLRAEVTERESALQTRQAELQQEVDDLGSAAKDVAAEWQRIEQTRAELADADAKITSLRLLQEEHATRQAQLNLHQEELNTLSEDLQTRSAAFENTQSEQTALSAQLSAQLTTQQTELQQLAQQLADQDAEISVQRDELANTLAEAEQLKTLRAELEQREAASDTLNAAIEAERAKMTAREAELNQLAEALRQQAERLNEEDAERQQRQTEQAEQAEQTAAATAEAQQKTDALTQELDQLRQTLESTRAELAAAADVPADDSSVQQLSELNAELVQVQQSASEQQRLMEEVRQESADVTAERDELSIAVSELRTALEATRDEITAAADSTSHDSQAGITDDDESASMQYREMIEQLTNKVAEQQDIIVSLQNSSSQGDEDSDGSQHVSTTTEEVKMLHRELDERTNLLDTREESLREQQRMVEQSAGEIEKQRRAMLEARQQLEMARAEIQVASHRHDSVLREASVPAVESFAEEQSHDEPKLTGDSVPAVRSEIAELFGLGKSGGFSNLAALEPVQEPSVSTTAELMAAVDDYSQEQAAAVSMKFSDASDVLLAPVHEDEASSGQGVEQTEGDHDDFVSQYMEQLLSRNREGAGGALPGELTKPAAATAKPAAKSTPAPPKAAAPAKPKAPGQVSFIEQYMSGAYDESGPAETVVDDEPVIDTEPARPAVPRAKVDVEAMRKNMNSFRELSTKSVENALATHAKRQRRGGIANRSTLCLTLGVVCILMVSASLIGVIPFGIFTWLSIVAAGIAVADLMLKMGKPTRSGDRPEGSGQELPESPPLTLHQPQSDAPVAHRPANQEDEEEYFEI